MSKPELAVAAWPPEPLLTERLVLTETRPEDRRHMVDLARSEQAWRYLGGALSREQAERATVTPNGQAGAFMIRRPIEDGPPGEGGRPMAFVGFVTFDRRAAEEPGHVRDGGGELELSYGLHPYFWGRGYAVEATRAALGWAASAVEDQLVIAVTQTANTRSLRLLRRLGFTERKRFAQFGAEQSLQVATLSAYL